MMRVLSKSALVGWLALSFCAAAQADEQAGPQAVIAKAIKAVGGADQISKNKGFTWKEKGTYYGMGAGLPYTGTYALQIPDKFRMEITGVFVIVYTGDKGWISMNNDTREMDKDELAEHQEESYARRVGSLLPLTDKSFTLTTLGEVQVGDRPAVGVKVAQKGHRDINLFFDKESSLLVKSEYLVKAPEQGGKEVTQEANFSDFKEVDGTKHPMKINLKRDGKLFVEAEITEFKAVSKLDDGTFAKP
jgi:outer membrane lipoprotein-sorting protein